MQFHFRDDLKFNDRIKSSTQSVFVEGPPAPPSCDSYGQRLALLPGLSNLITGMEMHLPFGESFRLEIKLDSFRDKTGDLIRTA